MLEVRSKMSLSNQEEHLINPSDVRLLYVSYLTRAQNFQTVCSQNSCKGFERDDDTFANSAQTGCIMVVGTNKVRSISSSNFTQGKHSKRA